MTFTTSNKVGRLILGLLLVLTAPACGPNEEDNLKEQTFAWLDEVRDQRRTQIREHFEIMNSSATGIVEDPRMLELFHDFRGESREQVLQNPVPTNISYTIDSHFVHRYGNFYDILFVDRGGLVFFSIKQELDYLTNLFTDRLAETNLAKSMHDHPFNTLVDFEVYPPSGEPAAFFVVPVINGGDLAGWFVLQYASNALNTLLTDHRGLGRTGEVYLVNSHRLMLSDSRFVNDSTILGLVADHDAVGHAFAQGEGHTIAEDYRNVSVFSSFCTFDYFGTSWAMLVEIDEDEVLSRYFMENVEVLLPDLCDRALAAHRATDLTTTGANMVDGSARVDIGELRRINDDSLLFTAGVGPCTAIIAHFPDRFGYMVHLAPTDDVYRDNDLTGAFLGSQRTRFLDELLRRITEYDIRLSELRQVRFSIIATHTESIRRILEQMLTLGIELSQIGFLYNPSAAYANVFFQQSGGLVEIQWVAEDGSTSGWAVRPGEDESDLSSLLKQQLYYDQM